MRMKVDGQTIDLLPDMRTRERLNDFESGVRDEWIIVNEGGLTGKYPVQTEKHVGWEIIRDSEIHL